MKTMDVLPSHAILRVLVTERERLVEENEAHQNAREEDEKEDKKEVSCLWGGILLSLLEIKLLLQVLSKELLCLVLKKVWKPSPRKRRRKKDSLPKKLLTLKKRMGKTENALATPSSR